MNFLNLRKILQCRGFNHLNASGKWHVVLISLLHLFLSLNMLLSMHHQQNLSTLLKIFPPILNFPLAYEVTAILSHSSANYTIFHTL
jgi:hypothetical protein